MCRLALQGMVDHLAHRGSKCMRGSERASYSHAVASQWPFSAYLCRAAAHPALLFTQADVGPAGLRAATDLLEQRGLTELPHVLSLPVHDRWASRAHHRRCMGSSALARPQSSCLQLVMACVCCCWLTLPLVAVLLRALLSLPLCRAAATGRRPWCATRCGRCAPATSPTPASS